LVSGTAKLEDFMERLGEAESLETLQRLTEELRDLTGVDHVVYHWVNNVGERYGVGTYSAEWVDHYVEKGYLFIDPVIHGAARRFHPVDWNEVDWSTKVLQAFRQDAAERGIGPQGLSIPIRGPSAQFALFTVTSHMDAASWRVFSEANSRDLILIAHDFNRKALEFDSGDLSPNATLSPREVSAITLLAKGRSRAQAAEELQISEHTLRVYIETARHKLGALNTTHAVARALAQGLIVI
jgi:DNA-binding CsgD family transcriptional regulator